MDIWTLLGVVGSIVGIGSSLIAAYQSWKNRNEQNAERERLQELVPVTLRLEGGARRHRLPVSVPRGDLTRAELQGILGLIPTKPKPDGSKRRYQIEYMATPDYLDAVREIRSASGPAELIIPLTEAEVEQFAVDFEPVQPPTA